jgi:hypothetical protein
MLESLYPNNAFFGWYAPTLVDTTTQTYKKLIHNKFFASRSSLSRSSNISPGMFRCSSSPESVMDG